MASGNTLCVFTPLANEPPASAFATFDLRNSVPVLDFDDSTDESAVFGGVLPANYAGGGLTVTLVWMATSATSGGVSWDVAIEAHPDDAFDIDSDGFATAKNSGSATTASAAGEQQYTSISFSNGAEMDSLAAGESFRLKVTRDANATTATDDMSGDAQLLRIIVKET